MISASQGNEPERLHIPEVPMKTGTGHFVNSFPKECCLLVLLNTTLIERFRFLMTGQEKGLAMLLQGRCSSVMIQIRMWDVVVKKIV
jgi:hypothetical protein